MSIQERKKNPSAFLRNIFEILNNPDHAQIIHWAPQGNGFIIKDLHYFEANILPMFFKHKKFSSFVRQLNMYGFHKQRNSNFQNCFLHEQFRRGNEMPTDIKRKPEKKKRSIEPIIQPETRQANWLAFSQQLRRHFPHIAKNILVVSQQENSKKIFRSVNAVSSSQNDLEYKMNGQNEDGDSEQYVSRISLKGLVQDEEEKYSKNMNRSQIGMNSGSINRLESEECISHDAEKDISQLLLVRNQSQSCIEDWPQRKSFSFLRFKDPVISMQQSQNSQTMQKLNLLSSTVSLSFLDTNLQSLSGLSDILTRQNEILQKTHSTIRNVVLKSQQNKIGYINRQLSSFDSQMDMIMEERQDSVMGRLLEEEKQQLTGLTCILEQQIQGLTEFMLSEEELPLSMTSIKCRLQNQEQSKI